MNSAFVIICVSTQVISNGFHLELRKILHDLNLHSKSETLNSHLSILEFNETEFNFELLNSSLISLSFLYQIDMALIPQRIFEAQKKLVIFDMDSTLITAEVIDEMALKHGVGEEVKLITKKAMNGELRFDQSLSERVSLLKGFHRRHMEVILKELKFTPGTEEFIKTLRAHGIKTAIASGGFKYFAESIKNTLQMDYVFANDLEFEKDVLTGKILGPVVNAERKEKIISELAQKEGLSLDQIVAIGDGANDIPMLLKAGLGIAIHAKEKVQRSAKYRINFGPMTQALAYMGKLK